jgi:hypothetical protein
MTLSMPAYIQRAGVADMPVVHAWDDSDPEFAYVGMDERLQHRIAKTSFRGVMALAAGFAEWVAWRHSKVCSDPLLFQKIEAMWAGVVSLHYLKKIPLPRPEDWQGPVRGAVWAGANWLDRIVDLTRRRQFAYPEAVCLSQLVEYVLPDISAFKQWRRFAIGRLAKLYPDDQADLMGAPIPREALDPDFTYTPDQAAALIDTFLRTLDPQQNPFLCSAKEMLDSGFVGTPYRFP